MNRIGVLTEEEPHGEICEEKMVKGIKKILLGVAGIVLAADAVTVGTAFGMAVKRNSLFFKKTNKKNRKEDPKLRVRYEGIQWITEQSFTSVEIESEDGLVLRGKYLKAQKSKRIVVFFHGWRGSWQHDFGACLRWFLEQGCSLLLVDQRAQGESDGKYMGFGILERKDCISWLRWMDTQNDNHLPLYLYGVSMGAATVLMTAGECLPVAVNGMIADCGFTSPYEMVLRYGKKRFGLREHPIMGQLNWLLKKRAGYSLQEQTTLNAMRQCNVPVLFIHGKADTFVPFEMTVQNYQMCRSWKDLLLVPEAGHCMSFLQAPKEYKDRVLRLFARGDHEPAGQDIDTNI